MLTSNISINYKDVKSSESLNNKARKSFNKLTKFTNKDITGNLTFSKEKNTFVLDATITYGNSTIHGKVAEQSFQAAIDSLTDKLKSQIIKSKDKKVSQKRKTVLEPEVDEQFEEEELFSEHL